jgi:hypothetical protein
MRHNIWGLKCMIRGRTYSVRTIIGAVKMYHAVDASKGGAATLAAVGIKLLLGEHVAAVLLGGRRIG